MKAGEELEAGLEVEATERIKKVNPKVNPKARFKSIVDIYTESGRVLELPFKYFDYKDYEAYEKLRLLMSYGFEVRFTKKGTITKLLNYPCNVLITAPKQYKESFRSVWGGFMREEISVEYVWKLVCKLYRSDSKFKTYVPEQVGVLCTEEDEDIKFFKESQKIQ